MSETETSQWQPIRRAPRDGSRILAAIRPSEQGSAEVDVVRWGKPKPSADACWMSSDSSHACPIFYNDWEVAFWMPLPSWMPAVKAPGFAARLPAVPPLVAETDGSGI